MSLGIESLSAPLFVSWQLTRECNLGCVHCCTSSAPGKRLPAELSRDEALGLAREIVKLRVPYVMLCGGEPLTAPHFFEVAELLGEAGVELKIETNGQAFGLAEAKRLAELPVRSVQVSVDGATAAVYSRQRSGGSLEKVHAACRAAREVGLPLEITFVPTRLNIHEAEAVLTRAAGMGAFRFNTGELMRLGRAARQWDRLEPSPEQYALFRSMLDCKTKEFAGRMELCYSPFTILEGLKESLSRPPATLLVLPDGRVKVSAALGFICADLRKSDLEGAWDAYRKAWRHPGILSSIKRLLADPLLLKEADDWRPLESETVLSG